MTDHDKDRQLDEMLDALLATYSSAEPRPGLENRILATVQDATGKEGSATWWNFRWLWAGAVVAAVIIVAALLMGGHRRVTQPNNIVVDTPQPAPSQPAVEPSRPKAATDTRPRRLKPQLPSRRLDAGLAPGHRPQIFPTPTPLSEQERLLLRYFAATPREEVVAQSHPDEPPVIGEDESNVVLPDLVSVPQKSGNTR
jgi:hypothetical protein